MTPGRQMIEMDAEVAERDAQALVRRLRSAMDDFERCLADPDYRVSSASCEVTRSAAMLEAAIQRLSSARLALICMDSDSKGTP